MRASAKKAIFVVAGLMVLGFLLYKAGDALHLGGFSGAKLLQAIRGANLYYLILSLVAIYVCFGIRSLRWQVFQSNLGVANFWKIYKLTLEGFSAIFMLGRAGEPMRPFLLAKKQNLPVADTVGIYVLERIFDMASVAVIAGSALWLFGAHSQSGEMALKLETAAKTTGSILIAGVVAAAAVLIYLRLHGAEIDQRLHARTQGTGWRSTLARMLHGFVTGVQTIRSFRDLLLATAYSAVHWFLVVLVYYWIMHSFAGTLHELGLSDALMVLAFTLVGSSIQLPGVGGGSQAGSIIALTAIYGVEREPAVAAAMLIWLITFASCALAGVPFLIHEGWSMRELKQLTAEEKKELAAT